MLIPRRRPHTLRNEREFLDHPEQAEPEYIARWEQAVADWAGVPHAVCLNSGRQGMALIMQHLGIRAGDEVVVPAYTLGALISLVQSLGATPVPADVDLQTYNVTAATVETVLTERTKAVMVLHAFGAPAPVDEIATLCNGRGIAVIEDCAHALGATLHGKPVGSFGYAGFFSFEITKPVNTYGGGMVVTRDVALAGFIRTKTAMLTPDFAGLQQKVKAARTERILMSTGLAWPILMALNHPLTRGPLSAAYRSRQTVPSGAAAYTPAQARLGLAKWDTLPLRMAERARHAELYRALLHPSVRLQQVMPGGNSTWYFLVAVLPVSPSGVKMRLLARGIDTATGDEIADDAGAMMGLHCPNAAHLQDYAMALPLYEGLTERQIERVARSVNAAI